MPELETDIVLSAIRRGEDSLPKLRAATGLDYAKLYPVLHELEFEWKSINSKETADGFQRFTPTASEKSNGGFKATPWKESTPVTPQALSKTMASVSARDATLLQRAAPYCIQCRNLCLFGGLDVENRTYWRCQSCGFTFEGSSAQVVEMAHIDPHEEARAKIAAMVERGRAPRHETLDPEPVETISEDDEDNEIKNWRIGMCRKCGAPAIKKTDNICRKCKDVEDAVLAPCNACGTPTTAVIRNRRVGKCVECYKSHVKQRKAENAAARDAAAARHAKGEGPKTNGRPRTEINLQLLEDSIARRDITIDKACRAAGTYRNTIYMRRKTDPELAAAFDRGFARRIGRPTPTDAHKRYGEFCEKNCWPDKKIGHHRDCQYWKEAEAQQTVAAQHVPQPGQAKALPEKLQESRQNITKIITNNGTSRVTETEQLERAQEVNVDISTDKVESPKASHKITEDRGIKPVTVENAPVSEALVKERDIIPELSGQDTQMVTRTSEIHGSLVLREEVQVKVEEIAQWPSDRITEFFDALAKVVRIPQEPALNPVQITPQQLIDRFNSLDDSETDEFFEKMNASAKNVHWGVIDYPRPPGFYEAGYRFLTDLLDPYMTEDEQQAIWLLLRYLKKQEKSA